MNINLDPHTREVIKDFMEVEPIIGNAIKLASEVSYLKGYNDCLDKEAENQKIDMDKIDINMAYEGVN